MAKQARQAKINGTPPARGGDFFVKAIPQLVAHIASHDGLRHLDESAELVMVAAVVENSTLQPLRDGFYRAGDKMRRSVSTLEWPVSDDAFYSGTTVFGGDGLSTVYTYFPVLFASSRLPPQGNARRVSFHTSR